MQGFMECGEKADKGEIEMVECLKEVRTCTPRSRGHSCCASQLALPTQRITVVTPQLSQAPAQQDRNSCTASDGGGSSTAVSRKPAVVWSLLRAQTALSLQQQQQHTTYRLHTAAMAIMCSRV
jgi:hypothetical protein